MASKRRGIDEMLASSASGTSLLVLIQIFSKGVTFAANQVLLRNISPATLGISMHLDLYSVTALYFSRESIRVAIQRQPPDSLITKEAVSVSNSGQDQAVEQERHARDADAVLVSKNRASQVIVNMSYVCLGLGFPLVYLLATSYLHIAQAEVTQCPFFGESLLIVGLASLLELATEPFFAVVQQRMLYKTRAVVEMIAAIIKSFVTCAIAVWASHIGWEVGVLPMALGYLSYSLALMSSYLVMMLPVSRHESFSFSLVALDSSDGTHYLASRFSQPLVSLGASAFFQSVVKHILTQGDSMILAAMSSLEDQGVYTLASNYGGLVARIIFQPIEESSRNLFSKLLASGNNSKPDPEAVRAAKVHLIDIIHVYWILTILAFVLGPTIVPLVLHFLIGSRWTSPKVDSLLSIYCYYIPFLAFNGITEAFVSSTADSWELRRQAIWMSFFSACFAAAAFLFLHVGGLGANGLVWTNIVNMLLRITWSYFFIKSYFGRHGISLNLSEISLGYHAYGAATVMLSVMHTAQYQQATGLLGLIKLIGTGVAFTAVILYLERNFIVKKYTAIRGTKTLEK